jgi:hypothetical protein
MTDLTDSYSTSLPLTAARFEGYALPQTWCTKYHSDDQRDTAAKTIAGPLATSNCAFCKTTFEHGPFDSTGPTKLHEDGEVSGAWPRFRTLG